MFLRDLSLSHHLTITIPHKGSLIISELPVNNTYRLMQVCFEPTVSCEGALNRPADRLEIAPGETQTFAVEFRAEPL